MLCSVCVCVCKWLQFGGFATTIYYLINTANMFVLCAFFVCQKNCAAAAAAAACVFDCTECRTISIRIYRLVNWFQFRKQRLLLRWDRFFACLFILLFLLFFFLCVCKVSLLCVNVYMCVRFSVDVLFFFFFYLSLSLQFHFPCILLRCVTVVYCACPFPLKILCIWPPVP